MISSIQKDKNMNSKNLILLFINLLFILKVHCSLSFHKVADKRYEIKDDSISLALLSFEFINVAALIDLEWSSKADANYMIEFILHGEKGSNEYIFIRAKRATFGPEVKVFLGNSSDEIEIDCKSYGLTSLISPNKIRIKLGK